MKTLTMMALLAFSLPAFSQKPASGACANCAGKAVALAVPPELANMPKGRIENLMPVGMLIVLGCETCAGEAVQWALANGSSPQDIEAALRTVAAVQKLDCFREKFGGEVAARMARPLAAARTAAGLAAEP
jgi:alkylhydroperoxidase/carboxymuconolactone decarboxylase family protein YurZ